MERSPKKINILSFALASDARDSHAPVSDQGDCPPPLPALLTQDSMSRERRHMAGVTWEGGSVVLFGALGRVYSRRPWPCLRFRTNDVLLGTSGVGVRFSVVSIQLFRPVNIFLLVFGYIGFESTSLSQQPPHLSNPRSNSDLSSTEWLLDRRWLGWGFET